MGGDGGFGAFSASTDVLVFRRSAAANRQLTRFDRKGHTLGILGEPVGLGSAAFSPDGKRVAIQIQDPANSPLASDIWISDLRGFRTRLTFGPGFSFSPVWSPDGSRIAFGRDGKIYRKAADRTGDEETLPATGQGATPEDWSRDRRYLLYSVQGQGGRDIWVLPLDGNSKPFPFLSTPADEHDASFSPDGRFCGLRF